MFSSTRFNLFPLTALTQARPLNLDGLRDADPHSWDRAGLRRCSRVMASEAVAPRGAQP